MSGQQELGGVGDRVQARRKLAGMTQVQLARHASVSLSLVEKVERGEVPASPSFVAAVAGVLRVSTPELYGQPSPRFGVERAGVADLEIAVMAGAALATDGPVPTVETLMERVDDFLKVRKRAQYQRLANELPKLLADAHAATGTFKGDAQRKAWTVLAKAYLHASITLYRLGSDVAGQAADAGVRSAGEADDPALASVISVDGCLPLMLRGAFSAVEMVTDRARTLMDGHADDIEIRSARGHAHLRAAIVSARTGNLGGSTEHLEAARHLAEQVPATASVHGTSFNRDNVVLHAVAAAVEAGDGAEALARRAPLGRGLTPSRIAHHHIDLSRAHFLDGNRKGAFSELQLARRAAPQLVRYHPQVQETILVLAENDRRSTDSLAGFAKWAGIEL